MVQQEAQRRQLLRFPYIQITNVSEVPGFCRVTVGFPKTFFACTDTVSILVIGYDIYYLPSQVPKVPLVAANILRDGDKPKG